MAITSLSGGLHFVVVAADDEGFRLLKSRLFPLSPFAAFAAFVFVALVSFSDYFRFVCASFFFFFLGFFWIFYFLGHFAHAGKFDKSRKRIFEIDFVS